MKPKDLSQEQSLALLSLVNSGRLRRVPIDFDKAERFLFQSQESLSEVGKIVGAKLKHGIAYDCAHDVAESLVAAYGYATTNMNGQHQTLGEVLRIIFVGSETESAAEMFENVRIDRNNIRYRSNEIGQAQSESAVLCAQALLEAATQILHA